MFIDLVKKEWGKGFVCWLIVLGCNFGVGFFFIIGCFKILIDCWVGGGYVVMEVWYWVGLLIDCEWLILFFDFESDDFWFWKMELFVFGGFEGLILY